MAQSRGFAKLEPIAEERKWRSVHLL